MPTTIDTAFLDTMPPNVAVQFFDRVAQTPDAEAFRFPVARRWESVTWKQAGDKVDPLAAGLIALGIEPEQRVGIASGTRYEWILADLAIMCAGGATTTVYPTHQRRGHGLHPGATPSATSSSPRTTSRSPSSTRAAAELPARSTKVITFDGRRRRRLGDLPGRPRRRSARSTSPSTPDVVEDDGRRRSVPTSWPP